MTDQQPPAPTSPNEPPARLETFEIRVRMDATITVDGGRQHWVKPGAEGAMVWRGHEWGGQWIDPVPTQEELQLAFKMIQKGILSPVLAELVEVCQRAVIEAQQGKQS